MSIAIRGDDWEHGVEAQFWAQHPITEDWVPVTLNDHVDVHTISYEEKTYEGYKWVRHQYSLDGKWVIFQIHENVRDCEGHVQTSTEMRWPVGGPMASTNPPTPKWEQCFPEPRVSGWQRA